MRPLGHLIQGLISSCSFPKGSPLKLHTGLEGFSRNLGSDINTQSIPPGPESQHLGRQRGEAGEFRAA